MIRKRKIGENHVVVETYYWDAEVGGKIVVMGNLTKHYGQSSIDREVEQITAEKEVIQNTVKADELSKKEAQLVDIAETQAVMNGAIGK